MVAIGIDMPVGLTSASERRKADKAAREFVGPRRSSVFPTYPREVYEADSYDTARVAIWC
jgi:predicted RNase H-like nuclease